MSKLRKNITDAFVETAFGFLDDVKLMVTGNECPPGRKANFTNYITQDGERITTAISVLDAPDADGVDLQLELICREEKLWCEGSVFLGQETLATLANSFWKDEVDPRGEVKVMMKSFIEILVPLFLEAVRIDAAKVVSATSKPSS